MNNKELKNIILFLISNIVLTSYEKLSDIKNEKRKEMNESTNEYWGERVSIWGRVVRLVTFSFLFFNMNLIAVEMDGNLENRLRNQIRKDLTSELIIDILYNNVYQGEYHNLPSDIDYILLDSNSLFLIELKFLDDTITNTNYKYRLVSYSTKFHTTFDQNSWSLESLPLGRLFEKPKGNRLKMYKQWYDSEKYRLYMNGLYIVSLDNNSIEKYNNEGNCLTGLDSISVELFQKTIKHRYFHYQPEKIEMDLKYLKFSFYSKTLERFFNGTIEYNVGAFGYTFELVNGVLR